MFGQILRTSNANCNDTNAGDVRACHPQGVDCSSGTCLENGPTGLVSTQVPNGEMLDSAGTPHRFSDSNVPGAVPIVNIVLGIDVRIPQVKGFQMKIEGGFYDAFFLGGGLVYVF